MKKMYIVEKGNVSVAFPDPERAAKFASLLIQWTQTQGCYEQVGWTYRDFHKIQTTDQIVTIQTREIYESTEEFVKKNGGPVTVTRDEAPKVENIPF